MKVYTITLTLEAEPDPLAKAIMKRFADVVVAYATNGPFEVPDFPPCDDELEAHQAMSDFDGGLTT